ncbi:hypothetical protein [Micromonospora sp. NBC_00421]|uniref:hypothetical protein n=1 Tax=Micromonospora sp. NBC_00421 TaxID=2975976 RepID=UPI002E227D89
MRNPFTTKQTIGVTLASLFVLCCCGGGIVGAVSDTDPKPKPAAAPAISATVEARKLGGALDTASPTAAPSPSAVTTTSAAAKPTPSRTPAARKTTNPPRTTAPKPKPNPTPVKTTAPSVQKGVHPGAFCSPRGALGRTVKGTLMRCGPKGSDTRNRWRAA